MIPFKIFKKLVLIWERTNDQVLKKLSPYVKTSENRTGNLKGSQWEGENHPTLVLTHKNNYPPNICKSPIFLGLLINIINILSSIRGGFSFFDFVS